ncbi:SRP14 [Bugula neritina]|uniref:Signal recognition particle 14 kDa protein n=1 Tax=Bugula neritina TaxID=10212 RepID=A0A7J7KDU6_BUGNE|nr:SRP14 [Bugula neritina]KAF6036376.1 SRP14 [Bugula neritina]
MKLENDKFLSELTKLFQSAETSGSVVLTMKTYDGRTKPIARKPNPKTSSRKRAPSSTPDHHESEHLCLIRAVKGNKKISTIVVHKDVNKFQMAYANLMRGNMTNLKKKGRGKGENKSKQLTL